MNTMIIYGISNCDSVRKTRKFLAVHQVEYSFFDFKQQLLDEAKIQSWLDHLTPQCLINKRSKSFHQLDDATKRLIYQGKNLALILQQHLLLIKRPVIEWGDGTFTAGYHEVALATKLANS